MTANLFGRVSFMTNHLAAKTYTTIGLPGSIEGVTTRNRVGIKICGSEGC